jgi:hypothetical protein
MQNKILSNKKYSGLYSIFFSISIIYFFDFDTILNHLILKNKISNIQIADFFTISAILFNFFIIASGYVFDKNKNGSKLIFISANIISIIMAISLLTTNDRHISNNIILSLIMLNSLKDALMIGKLEAAIYKEVAINIDKTSFKYPKYISFAYLLIDIMHISSPMITTIFLLTNHDSNTIKTCVIIFYIALALSSTYIIMKTKDSNVQSKKTNFLLNLKNSIKNKKNTQNILLFGFFTSHMFLYKEILTIGLKSFGSSSVITFAQSKSIYYGCMIIGCIFSILFSNKILDKKKDGIFTYSIPIIATGMTLASFVLENIYLLFSSIFLISFSFCTFESLIGRKIDRESSINTIGSIDSAMWLLSSIAAMIFSSMLSIISRVSNTSIGIQISLSLLLLCIIAVSRKHYTQSSGHNPQKI